MPHAGRFRTLLPDGHKQLEKPVRKRPTSAAGSTMMGSGGEVAVVITMGSE